MPSYQGKFVWYELMTGDMAAAQKFYQGVLGWGAQDSGMPGMAYTLFSNDGAPVAGLMTVPEEAAKMGARPAWMGYVAVDDVDASAAQATKAGGKLYRPATDIPGVGRFAVVADPHGAVFMVFKPIPPAVGVPPEPPGGTPGRVGWHELHAGDREADFAFYSGLFGWAKGEAVDMGAMGTYQLFTQAGVAVGGMMTKTAQTPMPFWLYYVNVAGVDAAAARAKEHGGQIMNGPHQVPGGSWIVHGLDPQGAMFAMVGPKG